MVSGDAPPTGGSQTLQRGLRLLRILAAEPDGLTVSQLAAALGTHRAGVYRLLGPLADARMVVRIGAGAYVLGPGLAALAAHVRPRLHELARPALQRLADELGATTALTLRDGEEAVVADVVEPRGTDMHIAYRAGLRHHLDQAASGVAILAGLPPRPGERDDIALARRRGWSLTHSELLPGATGVGAPIRAADGSVEAAVTAVWTDDRDPAAPAAAVIATAQVIAAAIG